MNNMSMIKKVATLSVLCSILVHATADVATIIKSISAEQAKKVLGWNPNYALHRYTGALENGDDVAIYCHGVGENQDHVGLRLHYGLIEGHVIAFDFADVNENKGFNITQTSFGQEHDTQALLYLLKQLDDAGSVPRFHLYGYSRGGAVVLNAMKQLQCYRKHKKLMKKLKISPSQARSILDKIKAGTVILDCPLLDMREVTKARFAGFNGFMDVIFGPFVTGFKYVPWNDQGIKSAFHCQELDLALLVHFQQPDTIVTNACDTEFYELIKGPRTQCVIGNDGGHFHKGETLAPAIREFRRVYGGSYKKA